MHVPIDPHRKYAPSEIYRHGFILNTKGKPDYQYVLHLIKIGRLRAENVCEGEFKKYFKVLGSDIIKWKNSTETTIPEQPEAFERKKREHHPYPQSHPMKNE